MDGVGGNSHDEPADVCAAHSAGAGGFRGDTAWRVGGGPPAVAPAPTLALTPVTLRVLQDTVTPVPATDGAVHIAYVAQVANLAASPTDIIGFTPVDPAAADRPIGRDQATSGNGSSIVGKVRPFGAAEAGEAPLPQGFVSRLRSGATGLVFFDVAYPDAAALPGLLAHRLELRDTATGTVHAAVTDPLTVDCAPPVVLRPPLLGHGWWDGNGCCVVSAHRGAILPVNGRLMPPEQFAIDFEQVREDGTCCTGPLADLASWPFYGAPVLAAATGPVVAVERDEPDQVPGRPVVGITAANAGGNLVIQRIDAAHYVAYAHLQPGSIPDPVTPGAVLHAGDRLGAVGNSGNSTAPHLHFQVMDRPSLLNAVGLPFVFDSQRVEGRVVGTEAEADDRFESGRALAIDKAGAGIQQGRMPASGQVFAFGPE